MAAVIYTAKVTDAAGKTATVSLTVDVTVPSGWPSAATTGVPAGTVLTNSGSRTITTANTVVQNLNVTGTIAIRAGGCTVKNCRINANGAEYGVDSEGGPSGHYSVTVQDCEILNNNSGNSAIDGSGIFLRNNIHGFENGIVTEGNCLVQDNFIHALGSVPGGHLDGISVQNGSNTTIRHNRVESQDTSCVFIKNDFSAIANIIVDNNFLIQDKPYSFAVYSDAEGGHGTISGVQFTNNLMQRGVYGYGQVVNNTVVWTNNRDWQTNAIIPLGQ